MFSPRYVFREDACARDIWEREFPLYEDDLEAARCADDIYCPACDTVIVKAVQ